jgi:hypothetical protein
MHGQHRTALRACPFDILILDKIEDAAFPDARQVFQYAQSIPGPVALVQVGEARAGVLVAFEAILKFPLHQLFAIFDGAIGTGLHFQTIIPPAAGTDIHIPGIRPAQPAVDPARGDQERIGGIGDIPHYRHFVMSCRVVFLIGVKELMKIVLLVRS